jgi:GxxExxY protein
MSSEVWVDVYYKGVPVKRQRIDRIVDGKVVVEIKASALLPPYAERQLLTNLKATPLEVGLLLHFGPKPEFHRLVSSNRGHLGRQSNS